MATTNIIPFADATSNIYSDVAYNAFAPTGQSLGYQPPSGLHNKVFLQSSIIVTALAKFIIDYQSNDVLDSDTPTNIASYLLLALKAALGVTAPQFDSSLALATTQFTQRSLGNAQQTLLIDGVSPTYTLTPAQVGSYVLVNPSAPMTITLPLASACPTGGLFRVAVFSPNIIFAAQGGNVINDGGVNLATYPVPTGGFVDFLWDGAAVWIVAGGNTNIDKQPGWEYLDANPGFTRFPNGRLEQEGSAIFNAPASPSVFISVTINFAIPFSAKPLAPPSFSISTYNNVYDNDIAELVCGTLSWTDSTATALISRVAGNAPVAPLWLNVRATGRG